MLCVCVDVASLPPDTVHNKFETNIAEVEGHQALHSFHSCTKTSHPVCTACLLTQAHNDANCVLPTAAAQAALCVSTRSVRNAETTCSTTTCGCLCSAAGVLCCAMLCAIMPHAQYCLLLPMLANNQTAHLQPPHDAECGLSAHLQPPHDAECGLSELLGGQAWCVVW